MLAGSLPCEACLLEELEIKSWLVQSKQEELMVVSLAEAREVVETPGK